MHHPHPDPTHRQSPTPPRALASASPIAPPRPTLALLSAAHAREMGVRAACSAPAASGGRGGRWLVCQSRPFLPSDENPPENFPSPQVNFDVMHDRDQRCSALEPHPLPDPSTKKRGVRRRRVSFLCLDMSWRMCAAAAHSRTHPWPHTHPRSPHARRRAVGVVKRVGLAGSGARARLGRRIRPRGVGKGFSTE